MDNTENDIPLVSSDLIPEEELITFEKIYENHPILKFAYNQPLSIVEDMKKTCQEELKKLELKIEGITDIEILEELNIRKEYFNKDIKMLEDYISSAMAGNCNR